MPEILGSPYVLPALIVVVLLLILVLVLLRSSSKKKAVKQPSAKVAEESQLPTQGANVSQTEEETTKPTTAGSNQERTIPTWQPAAARASKEAGPYAGGVQDPAVAAILDLLHGWGDLTAEELHRLEIYEPRHLVRILESFQIPKEMQKLEHARMRLQRIRAFAGSLLLDESVPVQVTSGQEDAGVSFPASEERQGGYEGQTPVSGPPAQAPSTYYEPQAQSGKPFAEILSLPPHERREALSFLKPSELHLLLQQTDDVQVKKAVIDMLGNIRTPAALEILRACLEDPNPEVQIYALEAADRLLSSS